MRRNLFVLFTVLVFSVLYFTISCSTATNVTLSPTTTPQQAGLLPKTPEESLEPGVLRPSQINDSMKDTYIKVSGKISLVNKDAGGLAIWLSDDQGRVGLRIENKVWDTLSDQEKARYQSGNTVTVAGMLVLTQTNELFVVMGVPPPAPTDSKGVPIDTPG